jgi:predicted enzyme related to lactoylglutathione lyase
MMIDPTALCQIEIQVSDLSRSIEFYREVFGWQPVPAFIHEYVVLDVPEHCQFGVSLVPQPNLGRCHGNAVRLYFRVSDAPLILERASTFGGQRLPGRSLPGYGRVEVVTDPDGNAFGLFSAFPNAMR